MRGSLVAASVLTAVVCAAPSATAAPPPGGAGAGGIGIRLVDAPTDPTDPLSRSYIVDRLAPGASVSRRVEISNSTSATADIAVYVAAAGLRQGQFAFAADRTQNELSTWTSVGEGVRPLQPGGKAVETVTIDVPEHASPGPRYAVVWAQVTAPAPTAGGVTLVNRVGVRIYLTVGAAGAPDANFGIGPLSAQRATDGAPLVVATIRNSGSRALEITGSLMLVDGPGGLRAGPFPITTVADLAPGGSTPSAIRLDKQLPRGPWRAQLRLDGGSIHREAQATLTFPRVAPGSSDRRLTLVAIVALLAAALLMHVLYRRDQAERGRYRPAGASS
jgi:hypothetical protein